MDSNTLRLTGTHLIEASAGTGKTYTIAHLYTRLVIGHHEADRELGAPLRPRDILVMTFTEAATLELRHRIRLRLVAAATLFARGGNTDPALAALRDMIPPERHRDCVRRLDEAAAEMDDASIYTIHGWCLRVLTSYAFESGIIHNDASSADTGSLYNTAVLDYWRKLMYHSTREEISLLQPLFKDPGTLETALGAIRRGGSADEFRYGNEALPSGVDIRQTIEKETQLIQRIMEAEEDARAVWRDERKTLITLLREHLSHFNGNSHKWAKNEETFAAAITVMDEWAQGDGPANGATAPLPGKLARDAITMKKGMEPPGHILFETLQRWVDLAATRDPMRLAAAITVHACQSVEQQFTAAKRHSGVLDFNDMLNVLDGALSREGGAELAATLRTRYPVALVDEFQDTDPVQFRILSSLYLPMGTLLLIGDPKQAIYRFRGADIYTYLAARRTVAFKHNLPVNWRSTPELVDAVNRCFARADTWQEGAFVLNRDEVPFIPVEASPVAAQSPGLILAGRRPRALTFLALQTSGESIGVGDYRSQIADVTAARIARWLSQEDGQFSGFGSTPLTAQDIAVLVRNHQESTEIRQALAKRGVKTVYLSDRGSLFETSEAWDVLLWLRAFQAPHNEGRLRTALATGAAGYGVEELGPLLGDDQFMLKLTELLVCCRDRWNSSGVLSALRLFLWELDIPARLRKNTGGDRSLMNVLHLAEWLQKTQRSSPGPLELIQVLEEQIRTPSEEELLRLESDESALRIVTVHKSKGLQYPIVVAPFVATVPSARNGSVTWRDGKTTVIEFAPKKSEIVQSEVEREELSEQMRLLYVALTRAQHAVILGVGPVRSGNGKDHQLHKTGLGYLLDGGRSTPFDLDRALRELAEPGSSIEIQVVQPEEERDPELPSPEVSVETTFQPLVPVHRDFPPWWVASFSAFSHVAAEHPEEREEPEERADVADEVDDPGLSVHTDVLLTLPPGAETGTLLHDLIESAGRRGFASLAASGKDCTDVVSTFCRSRGRDELIPELLRWLLRFLKTPVAQGQPAPGDLGAYRLEMEFLFDAEATTAGSLDQVVQRHILPGRPRPALNERAIRGLMKGFIDLVFVDDGRYRIADWKSNTLGPTSSHYTAESMAAAILEKRYDLQIALYNLALHRHLSTRLSGYDPRIHLGDTVYTFLRALDGPHGSGTAFPITPELVQEMDALFRGSST